MNLKGFSLVELLVVLAVMGVMMGALGFSFFDNNSSDLGDSQRSLISFLNKAKSTAVSAGVETRIIVFGENDNPEKYLRKIQLILMDKNSSGQWMIMDESLILPKEIWLISDSLGAENADWPGDAQCVWSSSDQDEDFRLSLVKSKSGQAKVFEQSTEGDRFLYIKCLPSGKFTSASYPKMPKLVFGKGQLSPSSSGDIKPYFSDISQIAGIQIQPFGGIYSLDAQDFSND